MKTSHPVTSPTPGGRRSSTSTRPSVATTGVGSMSRPRLSLYRLTFPPTTGSARARDASAIPSMASDSCHITSGCSGLPKLRQLTNATGLAPTHATLSADSATTSDVPRRGFSEHHLPLPSVERAMPFCGAPDRVRTPGPDRRSSAASPPGATTVFKNSWWSYCRYTHEGSARRLRRSSPASSGGANRSGSSASRASRSSGRDIGRL